MQTLAAATGDAAKTMAIDAELGTLQPGKRADFVVLSADPLADIRNTRTIESVWIDGRASTDDDHDSTPESSGETETRKDPFSNLRALRPLR